MARPPFIPTDENRRLVKSLSAVGLPQADIALMIEIRSPRTLRKHFRQELDRGGLEANSSVAKTLYEMATSGEDVTATIFWLKCRARWNDRAALESGAPPAPFIVSEKKP